MHKLFLAAVMAATAFAVPALPASAAPMMSDADVNCLVFPMLKKECWERGSAAARSTGSAVVAAASTSADAVKEIQVPFPWWKCKAAPAGSGHLLDC